MSVLVWFLLLSMKYLCLFSLKSLMLGLFMLMCSFLMSMLMSTYSLSWYSLIFFMVYMGGLLVLFMYISSLKFKPVFYFSKVSWMNKILLKLKIMFFFLFSLSKMSLKYNKFIWSNKSFKNFSFNLFKDVEMIFLVKVGMLLLIVLWVMTKLSFRSRSALRPFFD